MALTKRKALLPHAISIVNFRDGQKAVRMHFCTHRNEENRFVLTGYYTTKIFMNVSCSEVYQPSKMQTLCTECTNVIGRHGEVNIKLSGFSF